jgi:hypothetical protein
MARCGCASFPTCSCTIIGDGTSVDVSGNGYAPAPFSITVLGYPKPRPQGYIFRTDTSLTAGVDATISFAGSDSLPTTMWTPVTPTKLLIQTTGTYLINAGTTHLCQSFDGWKSSDGGQRRGKIVIRKNGTTIVSGRHNQFTNGAGGQGGAVNVTSVVRLVAGDYLEMVVNLAGMVSALTTPVISESFLSARWMGL